MFAPRRVGGQNWPSRKIMQTIVENERHAFAGLGVSAERDALLTVSEVAELLRVPVSWVYERTRRRGGERLPHIKVGKYLRFRLLEIERYLDGLRRD